MSDREREIARLGLKYGADGWKPLEPGHPRGVIDPIGSILMEVDTTHPTIGHEQAAPSALDAALCSICQRPHCEGTHAKPHPTGILGPYGTPARTEQAAPSERAWTDAEVREVAKEVRDALGEAAPQDARLLDLDAIIASVREKRSW